MSINIKEGFTDQLLFRFTPSETAHIQNDPVQKLLYATDIGYYPHASNHLIDRPSGSNNHILIHCVSGSGWVAINDEEYQVNDGEFFVIPANIPHSYGSQNGWRIFWLHFEGKLAESYIDKLTKTGFAPKAEPKRELAIELFRDMLKRLSLSLTNITISYVNYSLGHLLGVYCLYQTLLKNEPNKHRRVQEVIDFMNENIAKKLTLSEMSEYSKLSTSRFSQLFSEQTGHPPMDYFIRLKVHKASQLLISTPYKIKDIAELYGWDNPLYFSRLFKEVTGYSPKKYRKLFNI